MCETEQEAVSVEVGNYSVSTPENFEKETKENDLTKSAISLVDESAWKKRQNTDRETPSAKYAE